MYAVEVGGGGSADYRCSMDEMFERMCAWDDANYIMGAGTRDGTDTNTTGGIVDGHAYSVLTCIDNAGGSDFDMVKVRMHTNPTTYGRFCEGKMIKNVKNVKNNQK